jgi:hypothetical protein
VDDLLVIYNTQITNISHIFNDFNSINPEEYFTKEEEEDATSINFLDLNITRKSNKPK